MNRRAIAAALTALLIAACSPTTVQVATAPPTSNEAHEEFDAAVRLIKLGPSNYPRALERLQAAIRLDPRLWEAWYDSGWLHQAGHQLDAATSDYEHALAIDPDALEVVEALGGVYVARGKLGDAERLFADFLKRHEKPAAAPIAASAGGIPPANPIQGGPVAPARPGGPRSRGARTRAAARAPVDNPAVAVREVRLRLAGVLRRANKFDEATEELRRILRAEPRSAAALVELGLVYRARGKPELAELVMRRALEIDANRASAWNDLGLVLLAERRDQEAFGAFDKAAGLDPTLGAARYNRATVYLDCGDYAAAAKELAKLTEAQPGDAEGWIALGIAQRGQGKLDEARRAYEKALAVAPGAAAALYDLGVLLMDFKKDPAAARPALERFLQAADGNHPKRADAAARLKELGAQPPAAAPAPRAGG